MAKRVLLGITYGALGIALTAALTLSAVALAGRNLSNTAGSADVRLVGEDVRQKGSALPKHDSTPDHQAATPSAPSTSSGTNGGSDPHSSAGDHAGTPASGSGDDHEHDQDDD